MGHITNEELNEKLEKIFERWGKAFEMLAAGEEIDVKKGNNEEQKKIDD